LPAGCVSLIFADPPYYKVKGEAWDRQWTTAAEFLGWMGELADEWQRVLAPNGSLYVCASPQMQARVECVIADRFEILNSIVWVKPSETGRHASSCKEVLRGYFPNTERIIFAEQRGADSMAMGVSGYDAQCEKLRRFVFEPLRAYIAGEWERAGLTKADADEATGSQMSGHYMTAVQWSLPTRAKYEQLRERANRGAGDFLRREYEDLRREYEDLRREYEALRRPFAVSADVPYTDVWTFPTVGKYDGKHPCEKPRAMLDHVIAASSRPGDLVLDCFLGSGVTGESAVALGRRFVGIESGDYIHGARRRIFAAIGTPAAAAEANALAPVGGQLGLL
jgi:site-specific DNA-methyltransferase (adenine-specific)